MIDHISFATKDFQKSLVFYDETLRLLGYERISTLNIPAEHPVFVAPQTIAGYGCNGKTYLWISETGNDSDEIGSARGVHIAFTAPSTTAIDEWYAKCLQLGGKDNGVPAPRPEFHPGYYCAFIIDPNGWHIEACLHNYTE